MTRPPLARRLLRAIGRAHPVVHVRVLTVAPLCCLACHRAPHIRPDRRPCITDRPGLSMARAFPAASAEVHSRRDSTDSARWLPAVHGTPWPGAAALLTDFGKRRSEAGCGRWARARGARPRPFIRSPPVPHPGPVESDGAATSRKDLQAVAGLEYRLTLCTGLLRVFWRRSAIGHRYGRQGPPEQGSHLLASELQPPGIGTGSRVSGSR